MEPFTCFTSVAVPMDQDNIDTDQILPARHLMMPRDERYGGYVFKDLRLDQDGNEIETFILNKEGFRQSRIIVAAHNFGCGSSREHAPWALLDFGLRAIISTEIADIFRSNSLKNGLLPVVIDEKPHQWLIDNPGVEVTIDVATSTVTLPDGSNFSYPIDDFARYCLLEGIDQLGFLQKHSGEIQTFEEERPWKP